MNVTALGDLAVFGVRREEEARLAESEQKRCKCVRGWSRTSVKVPSRMGLFTWLRSKAQGPKGIDCFKYFNCCLMKCSTGQTDASFELKNWVFSEQLAA